MVSWKNSYGGRWMTNRKPFWPVVWHEY